MFGRAPLPPSQASYAWTDQVQQTVLNAHPVPARRAQIDMPSVRVTARVIWSTDGEETIAGTSDAYCGRLILVHTRELRLDVRSIWLDVTDVERHI
ncbi:hypothetical protein [Luteimicrobium subarcticum]|uniref:Uncharacterized protein n=1 Tax=Luteimicrobium subarcticum TaxID=620910 RepID=A0A2M8W3P0_9MICO|nr:hypothetical protein [Luteimicrobium subarcticum]PJI85534.1 hypothetical protein CLV34_2714 [Luteimicrobium subarcticum]